MSLQRLNLCPDCAHGRDSCRAAGALDLIAEAGGSVVEAGPEDTTGRKVGGSFLRSGTRAMFEAAGFAAVRPLGKHHWLVRKHIPGWRWQSGLMATIRAQRNF